MKPLILLAFLSGVGLLFGQSAHDHAPEPKFSELSRGDKRVERGERVDVSSLVEKNRDALTEAAKKFH